MLVSKSLIARREFFVQPSARKAASNLKLVCTRRLKPPVLCVTARNSSIKRQNPNATLQDRPRRSSRHPSALEGLVATAEFPEIEQAQTPLVALPSWPPWATRRFP